MSDDESENSGTSPVLGSVFHCTPSMVSLEVMCTYLASSPSCNSSCVGTRVNPPSDISAARFTSPHFCASLMAFLPQLPVRMYSAFSSSETKFNGTIVHCKL